MIELDLFDVPGREHRIGMAQMRRAIYRGSEEEGRELLARAPVVHLAMVGEGIASDDIVATLRAPFELIADVHPMPQGGDTLPTLGDVRRLGPVWGSVAVFLVGFAAVGWFLGEWPILLAVGVGTALVVGAWQRTRRDPAPP